jgi:hypothetical protein
MKREAMTMSAKNMLRATEHAREYVRELGRLLRDIEGDRRRNERVLRHECRACFYPPRIGGGAMTECDCMCCGQTQVYCSTAADQLCMRCAVQHSLCKRCGGDLDMRLRRKDWPSCG